MVESQGISGGSWPSKYLRPGPVPTNHCYYHTRRIWRAKHSPSGVHLAKFYSFPGKEFSPSDLCPNDVCFNRKLCLRACSSALNRIRLRAIFLHRAFQRLYRNWLTLHQPPLVEENLNRSPSRLGPVDGSCGAANTNFCKQLLGYSRVSAAEELRGEGC